MKEYYEIKSDQSIKLSQIPVKSKLHKRSEDELRKLLADNLDTLQEYQTLLYAEQRRSLLIIFQGMDTSGKDGAIKHVMSGINPQGCRVVSFKAPSPTELGHDFMWRISRDLPSRGVIGIFNRSYYEELLVPKVHPDILEAQKVPGCRNPDAQFWRHRSQDILNFEKYLHRQGTEIVKIFLHISKDEQKQRLLDRFNDSHKLWKISEGDVEERQFWKEYQKAYEFCLGTTGTKSSPWFIVPADHKESARLSVSKILLKRFKDMNLGYPKLTPDQKRKLKKLEAVLDQE